MGKRESIIEKIKALLAKTVENGATEAEMMAALDKAAAMQDAYEISDDELQEAKEEAAMLHSEPPDTTDPHRIKWQLCYGVRQFCGVEIYRTVRENGLRFIGMPSDVQFAQWLLDNLADYIFEETYKHLIGCLAPKSERRVIIRSFTQAACQRINQRLTELVKRSEQARTSNGRELVVVKNAAIKAFMAENDIHLGGFMLIDPFHNTPVAGNRWDLTAEDVIEFCTEV
jgi:hypothetical protein